MTICHKSTDRSGFTLIELAIVLVIVGLLVGVGSGMVSVLSQAIKVRQTRDSLDENVQAIASWASANNSIPTTATFDTVAKSKYDSWGRAFIYLYDTNLNTAPITKDTICGRRTTNITVTDSNTSATISNVAYLLLSQADDAATNTTPVSPLAISSATTIAADTAYDLVRWVTLDELRSKVGCQGSPLKIVNNELPFGNYSVPYAATITPDGGTGSYLWQVKSSTTSYMPRGILFTPSMTTTVISGASRFTNNSSSAWTSASSVLTIGGMPRPAGSYNLTIRVQDSNGNSTSKQFVMTINPN
jgi:prepilin-type N-terminal cleavage/methylation domain-containing protein